jgi:hypothetical protein
MPILSDDERRQVRAAADDRRLETLKHCVRHAKEAAEKNSHNEYFAHARFYAQDVAWLLDYVDAKQKQIVDARAANERDRSAYARAVQSLRSWCSRWSLMATSRGSYAWDDDAYKQEFQRSIDEMRKISDRLAKNAHIADFTHCPATQAEVNAARQSIDEHSTTDAS